MPVPVLAPEPVSVSARARARHFVSVSACPCLRRSLLGRDMISIRSNKFRKELSCSCVFVSVCEDIAAGRRFTGIFSYRACKYA